MNDEPKTSTPVDDDATSVVDVEAETVAPTTSETIDSVPHPPGVGGLSDVGRVRELNEDNWHWEPLDGEVALYAVADGMGGHDRGEVASQIAVESLFKVAGEKLVDVGTRDVRSLRDMLRDSMQSANRAVVTAGEEQDSNMGTTLVSAMTFGTKDALIANVGDSRA
jgi:serine/threonine protein phosphatase PrpC